MWLLHKQHLYAIHAAHSEHWLTVLQQEAPPAAEVQPEEAQDMASDEEMDDAEDMSEDEGSLEPEPPEVSCPLPESPPCHGRSLWSAVSETSLTLPCWMTLFCADIATAEERARLSELPELS